MPVSEDFLSFVVDQLSIIGMVESRRMFGGATISRDGYPIALVADDIVYLKADETTIPRFEKAGKGPFHPFGDPGKAMSYWELPFDVLEDRDELRGWLDDALAVSRRGGLPKSKRASRKQR